MSSVVDSLPREFKSIFVEVVGRRNQDLLQSLASRPEPTRQQRLEVEDILVHEFVLNLRPDDEPTPRGVQIDDALGAFLTRWPIEPE